MEDRAHLERSFDAAAQRVHYLRRPFTREPDFGETSRTYQMAELIARAAAPS